MPAGRLDALIRTVRVRKPSLPLRRLVLEAQVLAEFVETHWEPRRVGRTLLPGLRSGAGAVGMKRDVERELRELAAAVQATDAELTATKERPARLPLVEARRLLGELRASLRFVLGGRATTRRVFERVRGTARVRSASALATALETHAALAEEYAGELARLGDFAADVPERARRLALSLREARGEAARNGARPAKLRERDALVTLLMDRMREVRATVRFVFRDHPKVARQASSDYERKRKQRNARKRAAKRSSRLV